jgi:hypothetical protein
MYNSNTASINIIVNVYLQRRRENNMGSGDEDGVRCSVAGILLLYGFVCRILKGY